MAAFAFRHGRAVLLLLASMASAGTAVAGSLAAEKSEDAGAVTALYPDRVTVFEQNDLYGFAYSYPLALRQVPALAAHLDDSAKAAEAAVGKEAADRKAAIRAGDPPFRAHQQSTIWLIAADIAGWLSLARETYSATGAAHDQWSYQSILWDRKADRERAVDTLFLSPEAMEAALRPAMCDGLDARREAQRGHKVVRTPDDPASACIALKDTTMTFWASGGQRFNTITFLIARNVAGPYAEGSYDVTLPITAAMVAAIKPEFRDAFSVAR